MPRCALLQDWAARTHHHVRITFTLGVEPWGLPGNCLAVLKSAVAHGVRFTVNIMAFDYYIKASKTGIEMGTAAIQALYGTHRQLGAALPGPEPAAAVGPGGHHAAARHRRLPEEDRGDLPQRHQEGRSVRRRPTDMPLVSIWAIQRDNGGCPGTIDSNSCSGIHQSRWAFSHLLESYAGW